MKDSSKINRGYFFALGLLCDYRTFCLDPQLVFEVNLVKLSQLIYYLKNDFESFSIGLRYGIPIAFSIFFAFLIFFTPEILAFEKSAPLMSAPSRLAPLKSAKFKFA